MIQSILTLEGSKPRNLTSAELQDAKRKGFVWVDIENPVPEDFEFLKTRFPLHQLALSPVFESYIRSKATDFDKHLLIVIHEPIMEEKSFEFKRLIFFMGKNFLITVHNSSLPSIDTVKEFLDTDPKTLSRGPSFLAYKIVDILVDNYFPVLDSLNDRLDDLETKVFTIGGKKHLKQIFSLKRQILELRRRASPAREVLSFLARRESKFVDPGVAIYFRDVYDSLIRVSDMADIYRDILTSILDVYISVQSNRLNEVMKVLTVIATIILPLTFVVGFYGMNIVFPEVEYLGENSYFFILSIVVLISLVLIYYFRRKKWI